MQTTNVRQIKAALVEQAFHGTTRVRCRLPVGRRRQPVERATAGDDPGLASLVSRGECPY